MTGSQECPLFSSCFFPPNLCHSHPVTPPSFPRTAAACGRFSCPAAKANHIASARCKAPRAPFSTSLHWDRGTEKPMLLYLQIFTDLFISTWSEWLTLLMFQLDEVKTMQYMLPNWNQIIYIQIGFSINRQVEWGHLKSFEFTQMSCSLHVWLARQMSLSKLPATQRSRKSA